MRLKLSPPIQYCLPRHLLDAALLYSSFASFSCSLKMLLLCFALVFLLLYSHRWVAVWCCCSTEENWGTGSYTPFFLCEPQLLLSPSLPGRCYTPRLPGPCIPSCTLTNTAAASAAPRLFPKPAAAAYPAWQNPFSAHVSKVSKLSCIYPTSHSWINTYLEGNHKYLPGFSVNLAMT